MNGYDRIMATVQGLEKDRVAVSATLSLYGAKLTNCSMEEYFTNPLAYVRGQEALINKFGLDFIITPLAVAREAETYGCDIKFMKSSPPNIKRRPITKSKDIDQLEMPSLDEPYYHYIRDLIKMLADKYKGKILICGVWLDPLDSLANIVGPELFMDLLFFHREKFDEIVTKLEKNSVQFANEMLECGADVIIDFASLANTAMVTEDLAKDVVYPTFESAYSQIKGGIVLHHGGSKIGRYIDIYKGLPNLLGFVIDQRDDLEDAMKRVNPGQIVLGNVPSANLEVMTPEQIDRYCNVLLERMEDRKNFVLFTSGADVPVSVEEENIAAIINAASHGRYHG